MRKSLSVANLFNIYCYKCVSWQCISDLSQNNK